MRKPICRVQSSPIPHYRMTLATMSYVLRLSNKGWKKAFGKNATLTKALNIAQF
jgi:alanine dehydrogenase